MHGNLFLTPPFRFTTESITSWRARNGFSNVSRAQTEHVQSKPQEFLRGP